MAAGVSISKEYLFYIISLWMLISRAGGFQDAAYSVEEDRSFAELDFSYHGDSSSSVRLRRQAVASANISTTKSTLPPSTTSSTSSATSSTVQPTTSQTTTTTATTTVTTRRSSSASTTTHLPTTPTTPHIPPTLQNETEIVEEQNHTYYHSRRVGGVEAQKYWIDLNDPAYQKKTHGTLSHSHRTAATVELKFTFLFYGHEVTKVTIATGGFLYMSDFLHQWLTATQYIAPLMANFDTQLGNNSQIHYADNGTAFIVQWEHLYLQDHPTFGQFDFQAILLKGGKVIFVYKDVPVPVTKITSEAHPVKIGLSDAYYFDTQVSTDVRRRTIYEYHRVNISFSQVTNDTAIEISPRPTCVQIDTCEKCTTAQIGFECKWCPAVKRCSDGLDRRRQEWNHHRCNIQNLDEAWMCQITTSSSSLMSSAVPLPTLSNDLLSMSQFSDVHTGPLTSNTGPLTSSTGPLTSSNGPLTSSTGPLTSSNGPLTSSTSPLTSSNGPLTSSTSPLTSSTGPLTSSTGPLTSNTSPITFVESSALSNSVLVTTLSTKPGKLSAAFSTIQPSTKFTVTESVTPVQASSQYISPIQSTTNSSTPATLTSPDNKTATRNCENYVGDTKSCALADGGTWSSRTAGRKRSVNAVAVIVPLVIILILLFGVVWLIYAYRNPQSSSGMWLIEHRPSNLKAKLNNVRFWKRDGTGGEKYEVSMQPEGDSVA